MDLVNKKVIIIGMGKSGLSSANLCLRHGATVTLYDSKNKSLIDEGFQSLKDKDVDFLFGEFMDQWLQDFDVMVLSPGVPTALPFVKKAKNMMMVMGEIELAYQCGKGTIIGITGTNGKTTTTTLVGEIVSLYHKLTYVVGNIGLPYTDVAASLEAEAYVIVELSSYQLESIHDFRPHISCILNLTEDHLQRHKTMENYGLAKLNITMNQGHEDYCVLNHDDIFCLSIAEEIQAQILWISRKEPVDGVYVMADQIFSRMDGETNYLMDVNQIQVLGNHNVENVIAAIAMALALKIPSEYIIQGVKNFKGVAHRIEYVTTIKGIKFYNDSKATNPDSAIKAVETMNRPTVLIAGGMDKESDYGPWIQSFGQTIKHLVLFGETRESIKKACKVQGFEAVTIVNQLSDAVETAYKIANSGENILLSPACASWDMFKDFEARGDLFKKLVKELDQ